MEKISEKTCSKCGKPAVCAIKTNTNGQLGGGSPPWLGDPIVGYACKECIDTSGLTPYSA